MVRPFFSSSPTAFAVADVRYGWAASPDCNLYDRDGLPASPFQSSDMTTAKVSHRHCGFPVFGTTSVQLSERNNGELFPKRHQIKHLEFVVS